MFLETILYLFASAASAGVVLSHPVTNVTVIEYDGSALTASWALDYQIPEIMGYQIWIGTETLVGDEEEWVYEVVR